MFIIDGSCKTCGDPTGPDPPELYHPLPTI